MDTCNDTNRCESDYLINPRNAIVTMCLSRRSKRMQFDHADSITPHHTLLVQCNEREHIGRRRICKSARSAHYAGVSNATLEQVQVLDGTFAFAGRGCDCAVVEAGQIQERRGNRVKLTTPPPAARDGGGDGDGGGDDDDR